MSDSLMCSMPPVVERVQCEPDDPRGPDGPALCSALEAPEASHTPATESVRGASGQPDPGAPAVLPGILRAAVSCAGKLESVAMALLQAQASPLSALVNGMKAGYELGRCMAAERNEELQLQAELDAVRECEAHGGTPDELSDETLTCLVPESNDAP